MGRTWDILGRRLIVCYTDSGTVKSMWQWRNMRVNGLFSWDWYFQWTKAFYRSILICFCWSSADVKFVNLLNFTIDNTFSQWNWLTQFKSSWSVMNMADWCWLLPIFLSTMCHCYANVFMFIKGHQGSVAWRWNQGNWLVYCNLCVGIRSSQLSCWQLGLPCFRSGTCHRKPVRSDGLPRCHIA